MMALNALLEPRNIHPKMTVSTVVKISEFSGCPNRLCTFAKNFEAGSPPSRAKAYVTKFADTKSAKTSSLRPGVFHVLRDDVVMIEVVANKRHTNGNISKHTEPARL